MVMRVAINGFGRVGRAFLRVWLNQYSQSNIDIVCINDQADPRVLAYLLRHDSVHGGMEMACDYDESSQSLVIGSLSIPCFQSSNIVHCPWRALNVDCVLEATGVFRSRADFDLHRSAGAEKVLLSAPAADQADATLVYGVNHRNYRHHEHCFVSAASCTTHALAAVCGPLLEAFSIDAVMMTEIHAYTLDQGLLDTAHANPVRGRAAAWNMVPTETTGDKIIGSVLPALKGRVKGYSMRVPVINGACLDLTIQLEQSVSWEQMWNIFQQARQNPILSVVQEPLVSSDFTGHSASAIVDRSHLRVLGNLVQVLAWYDNEWAYAHRLLDFLEYTSLS